MPDPLWTTLTEENAPCRCETRPEALQVLIPDSSHLEGYTRAISSTAEQGGISRLA